MQRTYVGSSMRRNRFLLSLVLVGLLANCTGNLSVLRSDLTVQPGKQFVLGGNQKGAFTVKASNTGQVPVTLSERRVDGHIVALGTFAPGNAQTLQLAAGSAVLINNRSDQSARLDLTVTGDKDNLTMQERNPETP